MYLFIYVTLGFPKLNKTESTMRDRGCEVKAASSIQPQPAAVELTQENIYFPELLRIDNLLSARLYEMERERQRRWVAREMAQPVRKA